MLDAVTKDISGQTSASGAGTPAAVSMVEETRLLKVVKRLFTGSVKEVLGELLQNAQRAGAKNVVITSDAETVTIADDGTGLIGDGTGKFSSLMRIAESSYERASVQDQDPMGVGCFSLFALEGVKEVTIKSNGFQMTVDTDRLWNEDGYWQAWESRVEETETAATGLELKISASADTIKKICTNLEEKHHKYTAPYGNFDNTSAVRGYTGVLEVTFNGELLDNTCEFVKKFEEVIIETTYQGNFLRIGFDSYSRPNIINWYGQLINGGTSYLRYYLEVRSGRPVNPMSPSRRGIIKDAEFQNFQIFLRDALRNYILTTPREKLSPVAVSTLYSTDTAWAYEFSPYFTATKWAHEISASNFENWISGGAERIVLTYAENPILMDESVSIVEVNKDSGKLSVSETVSYGAQTFVPVIEDVLGESVYELSSGNKDRLTTRHLWWKPGADLEEFFVEAGEFTLTDLAVEDAPETGWQPVGNRIVFAFENHENWDICSVDKLIVGVKNDIRTKLEFLDNDAWCVWSYENDSFDSETLETDFRKSLEAAKARLFTDCLPDDSLELWKITQFFKLESGERVERLELVYPAEVKNYHPIGLKLVTNQSRTLEKQFLSNAEAQVQAEI